MLGRGLIALSIALITVAAPVIADRLVDSEPVLRLRLSDPVLDAAPRPLLRPRFNSHVMTQPATVPMPTMSVEDAGRVGKFAFVSTPVPNLVVAIGATEDSAELGRQIDRAMMEMAPDNHLYDARHDRAPFIGLGVRSTPSKSGWAVDATIGAGLFDAGEAARLSDWGTPQEIASYEAEARANFRLRYRF